MAGGRRGKRSGATGAANAWQAWQIRRQDKTPPPDAAIAAMHQELFEREQATPKPWRDGGESQAAGPSKS